MAYENLSKHQNTTNFSERDINKKFNLVEFNRIFEQNDSMLANKNKLHDEPKRYPCSEPSKLDILFIIVCIILTLGILLLLFNNFISTEEN